LLYVSSYCIFSFEHHWDSVIIELLTFPTHYNAFESYDVFSTEEGPPLSTKEVRTMTVLRELPFLVAFQDRVLVFQSLVLADKMEHQGEHSHFLQGPSIQVAVRRNYLYEDAFDKLSPENGKLQLNNFSFCHDVSHHSVHISRIFMYMMFQN